MKASPACIALIKSSEGHGPNGSLPYLEGYLCPAGVPTIGWGHTGHTNVGDVISVDQAETLLFFDIGRVEQDLLAVLPVGIMLTQGQWDALVSLCFNLRGGARVLPQKAPKLWGDLLAGRNVDAAREFLDMDHANGVELEGLKIRRQKESALFLS